MWKQLPKIGRYVKKRQYTDYSNIQRTSNSIVQVSKTNGSISGDQTGKTHVTNQAMQAASSQGQIWFLQEIVPLLAKRMVIPQQNFLWRLMTAVMYAIVTSTLHSCMKSQINIGINTCKTETFLMLPIEKVRMLHWKSLTPFSMGFCFYCQHGTVSCGYIRMHALYEWVHPPCTICILQWAHPWTMGDMHRLH